MRRLSSLIFAAALLPAVPGTAAEVVPTDVQLPGTQPGDVNGLESPDRCDNCHGGYDPAVEPAFTWRGGMMAHATRDPFFWATVAIAEQDFDGAGDLCIRCHTADGWLGGRSTPTDGSDLNQQDMGGVSCDLCHKLVNPDDSEHVGEQNAPFLAQDGGEGWVGNGMYVIWGSSDKLGPYATAPARHQVMQSAFHRSVDFCGTCHDVSNPVVGDLAHNFGAQLPLDPATTSGVPGAPVEFKAAFNNPPYAYGVIERTFSEYKSSPLAETLVSDYATLPPELQDGAIEEAWQAAVAVGNGGDYADGTPRTFTCQTCHMPPVQGLGSNKNHSPLRLDLPLHDLTGGNYWVPEATTWMDSMGMLVVGGGLSSDEVSALEAGALRARATLDGAASLTVTGDVVRVVNLTGHKLPSGYPEGRRIWLDIRWFDAAGALLRHDGEYGPVHVVLDGAPLRVDTLVDPGDPNTHVWEAHYGITQEWAAQLLSLGWDPAMPIAFDPDTSLLEVTLADVAAMAPGTAQESLHFVLNNVILADPRIPPWAMDFDEAERRNALPVPADQFGDPGPGGAYEHWVDVGLRPPAGASSATLELLYQPTTWENIQFLYLANDGSVPFLADTGEHILEAWLATGMAEPALIASATWGTPSCVPDEPSESACSDGVDSDCDGLFDCDDPDCQLTPACFVPPCDNDGLCEPGEDCHSCVGDCDGVLNGKPGRRYCCGDGHRVKAEGDGSICDGNY